MFSSQQQQRKYFRELNLLVQDLQVVATYIVWCVTLP